MEGGDVRDTPAGAVIGDVRGGALPLILLLACAIPACRTTTPGQDATDPTTPGTTDSGNTPTEPTGTPGPSATALDALRAASTAPVRVYASRGIPGTVLMDVPFPERTTATTRDIQATRWAPALDYRYAIDGERSSFATASSLQLSPELGRAGAEIRLEIEAVAR